MLNGCFFKLKYFVLLCTLPVNISGNAGLDIFFIVLKTFFSLCKKNSVVFSFAFTLNGVPLTNQ